RIWLDRFHFRQSPLQDGDRAAAHRFSAGRIRLSWRDGNGGGAAGDLIRDFGGDQLFRRLGQPGSTSIWRVTEQRDGARWRSRPMAVRKRRNSALCEKLRVAARKRRPS